MFTPLAKRAVRDGLLLTFGAFLYTLASPPYEWTGAGWLALTPLYLVLHDKTPKTAFVAGLLYGVLFGMGIAGWAYFSIAAYFPFPFPLDLLLTLLSFSVAIGPYTGLVATLSSVLMRRGRPGLRWLGIPALWVSGELIRSYVFFGFCWELLGYTQYRHLSLIQIADITGVYGLSFFMALSGYVGAEILLSLRHRRQRGEQGKQFPWLALGCLVTGVAVVWCYGTLRLQQGQKAFASSTLPTVRFALVQGNVPSAQRWERQYYDITLLKYAAVTRRGIQRTRPDVVVWPEFAVGFHMDKEPLLRAQLSQITQAMQAFLLLGAPRMEEAAEGVRYYNSAYLLAPDGALVDVYDKIKLVPFAESRPLGFPALLNQGPEEPGEFTAGTRSTIFALPHGPFGVIICYEATYPYLARRLVRGGAQFLVNMSNDTWLIAGGDAAAAQHFSMSVFRAVETRRYLVRAATAGISGFVDPLGRPYHLSAEREGVVLGELSPRQEMTVYARYGDWFAVSCLGLALWTLRDTRRRV